MRRLAITLISLSALAGCATRPQQNAAAEKRSVDAVVVSETQRQTVLQAINAGATPYQAMAKVSDGPKNEEPVPK